MPYYFIGLDTGSVSAKITIIDEKGSIVFRGYDLHKGNPLASCKKLAQTARNEGFSTARSICTTGSARKLIGAACSAETIKNEITAVWRGIIQHYPDARTIIEIGGQDSKLISLRNGEIDTFKLNSVCAAGTGSFIQQQASRLGISIEELSAKALESTHRARFSGRCTVFVETEMINLQQRGYSLDSIAAGLSDAVCENYLKDLSPGIELAAQYIFCGGVAALESIAVAFARRLGSEPVIPEYFRTAGAYGAALIARDFANANSKAEREFKFEETVQMIDDRRECSDCLMCGKCFGKTQ